MELEDTKEWKQSMKMRPACDRVLQEVFQIPKDNIIRYQSKDNPHILDQEFAIDLRVLLENGMSLTCQEKALSNKFHHFRTFTIEFWQNRHTEEPGEFNFTEGWFRTSGLYDLAEVEKNRERFITILIIISWSCKIYTTGKELRTEKQEETHKKYTEKVTSKLAENKANFTARYDLIVGNSNSKNLIDMIWSSNSWINKN